MKLCRKYFIDNNIYIIMAHLQHFRNKQQPNMLQSIGNKVKNAAEFIAIAKGAWDVGRSIYHAGVAAAPYIAPAIGAALL